MNCRKNIVVALILAGILLFCLPLTVAAQSGQVPNWNETQDRLESAVGLHFGCLGGNGLAFRVPLRWWFYLQTAGGIWHSSDNQRHNLGLELNYVLRQDSRLRLYLAGGFGYFYHRKKIGENDGVELWEKDKNLNSGFGVGMEFLKGPRWSIQVEGDFVHEEENGETKVFPQLGVYYYW